MTKLYKDMTITERKAAFDDYREAVEIHISGFVARPSRGSYDDRRAWLDKNRANREASFILRVAKSLGDPWAQSYR